MHDIANHYADLLAEPGRISAEDVRRFRRDVFIDGVVSQPEAEGVFAMNNAVASKCEEWNEFFVEAMVDYTVNQAEPRGYLSLANAEWLIERISHDSVVDSATELELLVKVMAKARACPEKIVRFALSQIVYAVLEGEGPLARSGELVPGVIGDAEVELLRTVLFAIGGDGGISISRAEAEILMDLNGKTDPEQNSPAWQDLFVRATANYLMSLSMARPPSRAEALARQEWLEDTEVDTGGFLSNTLAGFGKMFSRDFFDDVFTDAHVQLERAWREENERRAVQSVYANEIDNGEAHWLVERIRRDGAFDVNERALVEFIRANSDSVDPALQELFDRVA